MISYSKDVEKGRTSFLNKETPDINFVFSHHFKYPSYIRWHLGFNERAFSSSFHVCPLIDASTSPPGTYQSKRIPSPWTLSIKQVYPYHRGSIRCFPDYYKIHIWRALPESRQKCTELVTVVLNPICTLVSFGELIHTHTHLSHLGLTLAPRWQYRATMVEKH